MSKIKIIFLFAILTQISVINSASAQTYYTSIKQLHCAEKPTEFYLFYEGETVLFKYEKIGEVTSTYNSTGYSNNDLLSNLKYSAWNNCANGLLFTKIGFTGSEGQKYYSAVAVRIETDSNFKQKYGSGTEMTFIQKTENREVELKKKRKVFGALYLVGILAFAYILFS